MDRLHDIVIPASTPWLHDPASQDVCRAIVAGGHSVYFVGGCVRNALMGVEGSDIDLATDALPEEVMALAKDSGLRAVPTGIDHGTVTVVARGQGFEVTTFRRDVETDGRKAVVRFTGEMIEDARRRDFTINALYATPSGKVLDPLNGYADLRARRVRFIEDAAARIREDYLRILRFFRFHAWYADPADGFEPDTLSAISETMEGLETLSRERVGLEMTKLLKAPNPGPSLATMQRIGVLATLLPGSDATLLPPVVHIANCLQLAPDWRVRLAILAGDQASDRLRLSKADAGMVSGLQAAMAQGNLREIAYRQGAVVARGALVLRGALENRVPERAELASIENAASQVMPVKALDLLPGYQGKALGERLKYLEDCWIASDFSLSRAELLARG